MKEIIEKIQKLLRLSESSNQHEAELAAQKAQEMLSKHNLSIDAVEFQDQNNTEAIDKDKFVFDGTMKKWKHKLMCCVVWSVDCEIINHSYGGVITSVTIYGLDQNVKTAIYMYMYLENTINRLRKQYIKQQNKDHQERRGMPIPANKRYHIEKSYTLGIVSSINKKLLEQHQQTPPTPGALVPVVDSLIKKKIENDFSDLKKRRLRTQTILNTPFLQGKEDGSKIQISKGITSTNHNNQLAIE